MIDLQSRVKKLSSKLTIYDVTQNEGTKNERPKCHKRNQPANHNLRVE